MYLFEILSRDRSLHGKLFSSLLPGELKSSPHRDINPLHHPYSVYSFQVALELRGVYTGMRFTPHRGGMGSWYSEPICRNGPISRWWLRSMH